MEIQISEQIKIEIADKQVNITDTWGSPDEYVCLNFEEMDAIVGAYLKQTKRHIVSREEYIHLHGEDYFPMGNYKTSENE